MNRLREENVRREHQNLQKNKHRARSLQGILEKSETLKDLKNEYKQILKSFENRIKQKEWIEEVTSYEALKLIFESCQRILDNTKVLPSFRTVAKTFIICNRLNPIKMPFDVRTATAIVLPYDGSHGTLNTFIDSANLLKDVTEQNHLQTAIKFLRTRLTGKARLGLPDNFATIDDLIKNVKSRCEEIVTPESILAKLKTTKQRGETDSFCNDVDSLCSQLRATYIESGVPDEIAKRMTTKAGVEALTAGVTNNETKIILKAGNFSDVKQAIQKVAENATSTTNTAQLLTFHNNPRQPERYRFNSHRNRGNFSNYNDSRYRNQRFQQPQFRNNRNFNRDNRNFQLNRNAQQGHFYNITRGRCGQNNTRRVYTASAVEPNQAQIHHMYAAQAPAVQMSAQPAQMQTANPNIFLGNPYGPLEPILGRYTQ